LPKSGLLYFFYDSTREAIGSLQAEKDSFAVLYAHQDGIGKPGREVPGQLTGDSIFIPARIKYKIIESEPGWQHPLVEEILTSWQDISKYGRV
jgi:uncharacterized protein YwqG